jgi:hypothetical protein
MDFFILAMLFAIAFHTLKTRDQRRRIALLATHLGRFQIEKLMETLTQGYLRSLGENEPARREQIWQLLATSETQLASQFNAFAADFAKLPEEETRASKIGMALPYADKVFPKATFDIRKAFVIHAQGISDVSLNESGRTPKEKAYTLSAEMLLMQHTCHWFCRSKNVASARMLVQHHTPYAQLVDSVSPRTRAAYEALTAG